MNKEERSKVQELILLRRVESDNQIALRKIEEFVEEKTVDLDKDELMTLNWVSIWLQEEESND